MRRSIILVLLLVPAFYVGPQLAAQTNYIDGPESVTFDSVRNRYFVTSIQNGRLVVIDTLRNQEIYRPGLGGLRSTAIAGDTLYVSTTVSVLAYDLVTDTVQLWSVNNNTWALDGLACDTSGYLYAVNTSGSLIRINRFDHTFTTFVTGLAQFVQDVTFDARNNRLLIGSFQSSYPIQEVSLPSGALSTAIPNKLGSFDGVTVGNHGDLFASTYIGAGLVVRWDSTFSNPYILIASGFGQPSGLDYNHRDNVLAIPSYSGDSVTFLHLDFPSLIYLGYTARDVGDDGDSVIEAGEEGVIGINLRNELAEADEVRIVLESTDPMITVTTDTQSVAPFPGWGTVLNEAALFDLQASASLPDGHISKLAVKAIHSTMTITDTIFLHAGKPIGCADDMESGKGFWTDQSPVGKGQWHLETYRSYSPSTSWKMGGIMFTNYAHGIDARLVSPPIRLSPNSVLTFQHRLNAEIESAGLARDGGVVMIGSGDGHWEQLTPVGGYPYAIVDNSTGPFEDGTGCYSGVFDWQEAQFDLAAYEGIYYLMFRFGSDVSGTAEGWYVDDVFVNGDPLTCCLGLTGNVDSDPEDLVDIGDLTALIGYLFVPPYEAPLCMEEANVDGDAGGLVDIGDLTTLIGYLFVPPYPETAVCP